MTPFTAMWNSAAYLSIDGLTASFICSITRSDATSFPSFRRSEKWLSQHPSTLCCEEGGGVVASSSGLMADLSFRGEVGEVPKCSPCKQQYRIDGNGISNSLDMGVY